MHLLHFKMTWNFYEKSYMTTHLMWQGWSYGFRFPCKMDMIKLKMLSFYASVAVIAFVTMTRAAMRPLLLQRAVNLASALRAYLPENFCDAAKLRCAQLSFHTFFHLRGFILRYIQCNQIIIISVSILTH